MVAAVVVGTAVVSRGIVLAWRVSFIDESSETGESVFNSASNNSSSTNTSS